MLFYGAPRKSIVFCQLPGENLFLAKKFSPDLFPKFAAVSALQQSVNTHFSSLLMKNLRGLSGKGFSRFVGSVFYRNARACFLWL